MPLLPPEPPLQTFRALGAIGVCALLTTAPSALQAQALDPLLLRALDHAALRYDQLAHGPLKDDAEDFISYTTTSGVWRIQNDGTWTSGFLPGSFWYLYGLTDDPRWQRYGMHWDGGVRSRATATDNDTGFQILDSLGTGLEFGRAIDAADYANVIRLAAQVLTNQRWNATIGMYRAWPQNTSNPTSMPFEVNIDMLMNMELILWSAANGGPAAYTDHAIAHADTSWRDLVRSDGSTIHVAEYDASGNVIATRTHQGWKADSTWSRGQAWAVYGFTVMYRYTQLPRMLDRAEACFDYFVAATDEQSADAIPYSDFDAPHDSLNPRDSSAAAIVASAALELYHITGEMNYYDRANRILLNLARPPYLTLNTNHEALLDKASEKWGAGEVGAAFADFYFLEAISRYWEWGPVEYGLWNGYPHRSGHVVRSGQWLGDLNVQYSPWIWLYSIGNWAWWHDDGKPETGDWIYLVKPD